MPPVDELAEEAYRSRRRTHDGTTSCTGQASDKGSVVHAASLTLHTLLVDFVVMQSIRPGDLKCVSQLPAKHLAELLLQRLHVY